MTWSALVSAPQRRTEARDPYARHVANDDLEALVEQAVSGDSNAWDGLVDRFAGLVWSIARSHGLGASDAADVSQTTWLRLAEHLHTLHDPARVGSWLATTARREALRVAKLGVREVLVDPWSALDAYPSGDAELDSALVVRDRDLVIQEALTLLPDRCRQLLLALAGDPPASYDDVVRRFGMPVGSIGPTRARCLEKLRALIAQVDTATRVGASARREA